MLASLDGVYATWGPPCEGSHLLYMDTRQGQILPQIKCHNDQNVWLQISFHDKCYWIWYGLRRGTHSTKIYVPWSKDCFLGHPGHPSCNMNLVYGHPAWIDDPSSCPTFGHDPAFGVAVSHSRQGMLDHLGTAWAKRVVQVKTQILHSTTIQNIWDIMRLRRNSLELPFTFGKQERYTHVSTSRSAVSKRWLR